MSVFCNLEQAIIDVLQAAVADEPKTHCGIVLYHKVGPCPLRILQEEYNIHFREPEQEQLKIL